MTLEVESGRHEEQTAPSEVFPHLAGSSLIILTQAR